MDHRKTGTYFKALVFVPMTYPTSVRAAEISRRLRRNGVTVRRPIDCLIAATAIEHDVLLLRNDRGFDPIETHAGLRVLHTARASRYPLIRSLGVEVRSRTKCDQRVSALIPLRLER